ncbi:uncharacterized protein G2W53_044677 [Senna tora]|uniref:Uncharacterized protein n=1 Tax=Senna tora TaxID=362788 RepID=A0A834SBU4_9FABA|nr:uncharacterized protein G2W53_044677 [Senna tora]
MFSVISRTASLNSSLFELHLFLFLDYDEASAPPSTPPSEYSMSSPVWGPDGMLGSVWGSKFWVLALLCASWDETAPPPVALSFAHTLSPQPGALAPIISSSFPKVFPLETPILVVLRIVHKGQQALD